MDWKPDDINFLSLHLVVPDLQQSIDFYKEVFGFVEHDSFSSKGFYVDMHYQGKRVLSFGAEDGPTNREKLQAPATSGAPQGMRLWLYVEDVDATLKKAVAAGGKEQWPPTDAFWGDRMAAFADPSGYVWTIAQYTGKKSDPPSFGG